MDTKIQLLPHQRHFDSFFELIKEVKKIENNERLSSLDGLNELADIPDHAFEQVKFPDGKYYLLPIKRDYTRLYRGEQMEYPSSKPTIYRGGISELDLIISNVTLFEFEHMLNQHPVVQILKNQYHFFIDIYGLAQHYGLKTDLMDFSSDPMVAGFFATCRYNNKTNQYSPYNESIKQKGVIYIILTSFFKGNSNTSDFPIRWGDQINPIGLQPFKRPGLQKAFSLRLSENRDLKNYPGVFRYTFEYDSKDALYFYDYFDEGRKVWINDDFSLIAELIKWKHLYSFHSLYRTVLKLNIEKRKIKEIKRALRKKGIFFEERLEYFAPKVYERIKAKWYQHDKETFLDAIFKRKKYSENNGLEDCLSIEDIDQIDMLRIFQPNEERN